MQDRPDHGQRLLRGGGRRGDGRRHGRGLGVPMYIYIYIYIYIHMYIMCVYIYIYMYPSLPPTSSESPQLYYNTN